MILDELNTPASPALPSSDINPIPQEFSEYIFADGDLSSFQDEFSKPKQDMGIDPLPDEQNLNPENQELNARAKTRLAHQTAHFVTKCTDGAMAFGLSLISKNPVEEHKANDEDFQEIEDIIYEYCRLTDGNIPLWLQLIFVLFVTYGMQIPAALQARKVNLANELVEKYKADLMREKERNQELLNLVSNAQHIQDHTAD
jgi:hypothetical protein